MVITFIHWCGMADTRCPNYQEKVYTNVEVKEGVYFMPDVRCAFNNDKLRLLEIDGKEV